jgi:hypothetical protein
MRRDHLIAILLAIAALPAGAALMVAPNYLHLTGWEILATFWGGVALTLMLIALAAFIAWRGESKPHTVHIRPMAGIIVLVLVFGGLLIGPHWSAPQTSPETSNATSPTQQFQRPPFIVSTAAKLIFACDIPLDPHVTPEQHARSKEEFERAIRAWSEMLGFAITISDVEGGLQIVIEAHTPEAKNRFISSGLPPTATKVTLEIRRVGPRIMVTAYNDLPPGLDIFSMLRPDPSSPQSVAEEKQVDDMLHKPVGTCHMI